MKRASGIIVVVFCAVFLLIGCVDENRCVKTMEQAYELLLAEESDSAFALLDSMRDDASHLSNNRQMRYYYLLGLAYNDKGEMPTAMQCFHRASDLADTTSSDRDLHTLSRIHGQLAQIFIDQESPLNARDELKAAYNIAFKGKDTLMFIASIGHLSDVYEALNMPDSAIIVRQEASQLYKEYGDEKLSALALGPIIYMIIDKGDLTLAKQYIEKYECFSGLFDNEGNIHEGYEIYYYAKSRYYLAKHQLDSADYYARKTIVPSNLNNQESGYKALYYTYLTKGDRDSIAKYAMLAYETNDSVYREYSTSNYQRMQAMYDFTRHQQLAEQKQQEANRLWLGITIAIAAIIILILLGLYFITQARQRRRAIEDDCVRLQQEKLELEELYSKNQSEFTVEIEEKQASIEALESKLKETRPYKDFMEVEKLLKEDEITRKLKCIAHGKGNRPSNDDWHTFENLFDNHLPRFLARLMKTEPPISEPEMRICLLVKAGFKTDEIATLMDYTPSTISKYKARLFLKIFNERNGGAKEFEKKLLKIF